MPQLNPAPWFLILSLSWAVILLVFKTKVVSSSHLNTPTAPELSAHHTTPWSWPWT